MHAGPGGGAAACGGFSGGCQVGAVLGGRSGSDAVSRTASRCPPWAWSLPLGKGKVCFVLSALGPAPAGRLALPPSPASQSLSPHVWLGTTLPRFLPGQPSIRQAAAALWRPRAESAVRSGPYLGCGHDAGEEGSFPQQVPGLTQADRCFRPGPALAGMCSVPEGAGRHSGPATRGAVFAE